MSGALTLRGALTLGDWRLPLFVLVAGLHAGGIWVLSMGREGQAIAPIFSIEVTLAAAPAAVASEPQPETATSEGAPAPEELRVDESAANPTPEPPSSVAAEVVASATPEAAPVLPTEPAPVAKPLPKLPKSEPKPAAKPQRPAPEKPREPAARAPAQAVARAPVAAGSTTNYGAAVMAAIRARVAFPPEARERGGGLVRVAFVIGVDGRVESASVASSSGVPALDRAALAAVRGISPPPPPNGRFAATAPIRFNLQ